MILEAKTSPPPRFIPLPKVNSQGRGLPLSLSLHWVVAPAFNICSDYSRSRNLMLSPRVPLKKTTFSILGKSGFLGCIFIPRRFSLEVSSNMECAK